ncbi:MAG: hypothetical protein IT462_13830 [Planctomycetes bacterium]|nr:hypothetical protein [Planctomycetota bacterium]
MSNKHYRSAANVTEAPVAHAATQAQMDAVSAERPAHETSIERIKRYLDQVVHVAHECLKNNDDLVSVREGLQAARTLLSVIKHEQRMKERAEKGRQQRETVQDAARDARAMMDEALAIDDAMDAEAQAVIERMMQQARISREKPFANASESTEAGPPQPPRAG